MSSASTIRSSSALRAAVLVVALAAALVPASGCSKREPAGEAPGSTAAGEAPGSTAGDGTPGSSAGRGAIGTPAPAYALPDLDGNTVRNTDFSGRVVILDFWATWCPPCREEVPHFVRLQTKYRDQGLTIVGLSLDQGGAKVVRSFAEKYEVNYPMLMATYETAESYGGIVWLPTTFVIDRSGKIVRRFDGITHPDVFEQTIRPLLDAAG